MLVKSIKIIIKLTLQVHYNQSTNQYTGYGKEVMLREMEECAFDVEKELIDLRYRKVKEIKNICRFCFTNVKNAKCVVMSKLETYSIDPLEMIIILGINQQYDEAFNEIICSDCFNRLIEFTSYRKKCQKAQNELIKRMQELDSKIFEIQQTQKYQQNEQFTDWVKVEVNPADQIVFKNELFDDSSALNEDNNYLADSLIKDENEYGESQLEFIEASVKPEPADKYLEEQPISTNSKSEQNVSQDVSKIQRGNSKKFECFFCRQKFVGKFAYKSHKCKVKRIKCEVEGCDSYFVNQGGYNMHLQRRHKMPKISRHLCPVCKTHYQMNGSQFDEHCKKCSDQNKYKEQSIQCDKCKKILNSLHSFTAHKMFHDSEDLTKINDLSHKGTKKKRNNNTKKDSVKDICDLCGKIFIDSVGALRRHQVNVHFIEFTGEMYHCDLCPIAKPTKALIYSHMKSTHIIRWHSCEICGKVFKNREGWRKHQLVHGDYKKNNRCEICPHQPGFVTASALKKHLAKYHGGAEPVRKFICDVPNCGAAYSRDDQLTRHRVSVHQIYHNNYNENIIKHYVNN